MAKDQSSSMKLSHWLDQADKLLAEMDRADEARKARITAERRVKKAREAVGMPTGDAA